MIGLLKKDFFILWHAYHKNLALVLVLYSVIALAMDLTFMVFFFAWISGFYILSGLTIDNYSKWDLYAASLPVSKRQIVGAKFILITLALLISFVIGTLLCGLLTLLKGTPFLENLLSLFAVSFVCLAYFGVSLVLSYKYGVEKARTAVLLAAAAVFGGVMVLGKLDLLQSFALPGLLQTLFLGDLAIVVMPVCCILVYLLCWAIATRIYSRKEF
ncbi:ABC-2 transporter permease [Allofournierella massiliensis]|uniref:ABC-2 transporter permease n=1 Tax=Allofournierella massiliensis TaxID=1650663 RepID=UPI0039A1C6A4